MSLFTKISFALTHRASVVLHAYADWRIGATESEKRCYKTSDSILLTFDDHGSEAEIRQLLEILDRTGIKAMFFPEGAWAAKHPRLVELIRSKRHVVGNHTTHHRVLTRLSSEQAVQEMQNVIPGPWLRPPQGRYDKRIRKLAAGRGLSICYWSIDPRDWAGTSARAMQATVLAELHPGAVILLHMNGRHTRELLPGLIDAIRARGYRLTDHGEQWLPGGA